MNHKTYGPLGGVTLFSALGCLTALLSVRGAERLPLTLPPPAYPDTETAAHVLLPPLDGKAFFKMSMDFHASPSNCLTAAFGMDADGDGRLSLREQAVELGWDGAWFIRRKGASAWDRREMAGTEGRHLFEGSQWLHRTRPHQRLSVSVDGAPLAFGGGSDVWLPLSALDGGLVRVTARGYGVEGIAELATAADGAVLRLK